MSRARKSSETICPERFCGPPQHSKEPADKGVVGLGGVFREKQQDVTGEEGLQREGVEETEGGGRRYKNRNKAHTVSNSAKTKPQRTNGVRSGAAVLAAAAAAQHVRRTQRESKQCEQQRPLVDRKRHSMSLPSMLRDQNQQTISSRQAGALRAH